MKNFASRKGTMQKMLAFIMAFALLFTIIVPASAESSTKFDLKKAIEISKEKLGVDTTGYDFVSNYNENQDGKKIWNLQWNHSTKGNITIGIDADTGDIINMNQWTPTTDSQSRIPKYSKAEALKAAKEIAAKLAPDKLKLCVLDEKGVPDAYRYSGYDNAYMFSFIRHLGGIPFQSNGISIGIDRNTLKLKHYNLTWDNGPFPKIEDAITQEAAKKIFQNELGIELAYHLAYKNDMEKPKAILIYNLKQGNFPIDAIKGEIIKNSYYDPVFYDAMSSKYNGLGAGYSEKATPQEQKVIDDTDKYISKETALETVKKYITIKENYNLSHAGLYAGYRGSNANWSFSWDFQDAKTGDYAYISAAVDAVTGDILNFYVTDSNQQKNRGTEAKYTEEAAGKIASAFLEKIQPERFKETEYRDTMYDYGVERLPYYPFSYMRKVNGVICPSDSINVSVDAYTGEITNYSTNWTTDVAFPAVTGVMNLTDAYKALYKKSDLKLKYLNNYDYRTGKKGENQLAYVLDNYVGFMDAKTGTLIDYQGNPIKENKAPAFTDIKGHYAEADIKLLAEMGILDDSSTQYMPAEGILQKDFIKMLIRAIDPYIDARGIETDNSDSYYNQAIQKKIISTTDKRPDAIVTRQEAAKMFVRAMGFGFVADMNSIYIMNDKDAKTIKDSNKGAVVIVEQLGIMTTVKGYFYPSKTVTRGEMATMLIRYLKIDFTPKE